MGDYFRHCTHHRGKKRVVSSRTYNTFSSHQSPNFADDIPKTDLLRDAHFCEVALVVGNVCCRSQRALSGRNLPRRLPSLFAQSSKTVTLERGIVKLESRSIYPGSLIAKGFAVLLDATGERRKLRYLRKTIVLMHIVVSGSSGSTY